MTDNDIAPGEILVEGYFRAGTAYAAEWCLEAADGCIDCHACGRVIRKCYVLTDGRIVGGDCAATLTGDDSTRARGEAVFAAAKQMPAGLGVDPVVFGEELERIRSIRFGGVPAHEAWERYRKASRLGARVSLGARQRKAIFDASLRARLA